MKQNSDLTRSRLFLEANAVVNGIPRTATKLPNKIGSRVNI